MVLCDQTEHGVRGDHMRGWNTGTSQWFVDS